MEAYYYIPYKEKAYSLNCGIKLSVKADKKAMINGYLIPCISALLNPKDDLEKYNSPEYICLRINLKSNYCFVANKALYTNNETKKFYTNSIIKPDDYIFGTYRVPECLITCTILPEHIRLLNKYIDSPVLYDNSEELYINRLIEELRDKYNNFDEIAIRLFLDKLVNEGQLEKIENHDFTIFTNSSGKIYTVKDRTED